MRAAARTYSGAEKTLVGIDVSYSVQQLLIEQGCLHRRFALMKKPLKIRQADRQGLAARSLELIASDLQPPEPARIYEMQLSSGLKTRDEVCMICGHGILVNNKHATSHPQMHHPLATLVKVKHNVFADASHPLHRRPLQGPDNLTWSRFERFGLVSNPDRLNSVPSHPAVQAVSNGFDLGKFRHSPKIIAIAPHAPGVGERTIASNVEGCFIDESSINLESSIVFYSREDPVVKVFDKRTAQALFTALVFAIVLLFLYAAWRAIIGFLFAIFFAYLLEAPVGRFESWFHGRRAMAIAAVYAIFLAALTLVFLLAGPPFMQEAQKLAQQAPSLVNNISTGNLVRQLGEKHGWSKDTVERLNNLLLSHKQQFLSATQTFVVRAARTLQSSWWLLLVPLLAIFFLKDGRKFGQIIVNSVRDGRYRQIVASTIEEMNTMLGHFIRVQLVLAGLAMIVITAVLSIMRVPYAVAVGPCAGALEFIPVVGPVVGGALVMIVALMAGYPHLLPLLLFLILWRGIQDYVTSPKIMGTALELHPLAVLFGVFAGGEVAGVIGVFLSIPVLASIRILWHTWQRLRQPMELPALERM